MGEIVHTSHITITREMGPTKVDPEREHAATLDHIVGAVGG